MQNNIDILNELNELSPTIAALEKVNVFTVPAGYFDVLSDDILVAVNDQYPGAIKTDLTAINTEVPQGYFDTLADTILSKIKMQQQEDTVIAGSENLSPALISVMKTNVFEVPQGYFDTLPSNILNKIKIQQHEQTAAEELRVLSPMLYSIQGENVFEVPHNYFNALPAATLSKVNDVTVVEELKIISPTLFGIQNKNVFEVPQGYFETLATAITAKVQPQQAKVVSMGKRSNSFMKYAVAAVFTCIVTLGVFNLADNKSIADTQQLASLEKIVDEGQTIAANKTFDKELAMITDADIVSYLQANGESLDINVIANDIDEKDLPTQNDYLLDEKALDNYLNGITIDDLKN